MKKLTSRQRQVYEFIKDSIKEKGYPPSVREIGRALGLKSSSTVHGHLQRLERKGYIRRDPARSRAIEIIDPGSDLIKKEMVNVPVVGRVTAGQPILAVENIEESFPLPRDFVSYDEEVFMLDVRGDSMVGAGILDGDRVLVRKQDVAENGDIVVALVGDNEATVKRFFKENDHFRLQPENPAMAPIIVDMVDILGKVIGLVRKIP